MKEFVNVIYNFAAEGCTLSGGNHETGAAKKKMCGKANQMWKGGTYGRQRQYISSE